MSRDVQHQQRYRHSSWTQSTAYPVGYSLPCSLRRPSLFPRRRILLSNRAAPVRQFRPPRPPNYFEQQQQNYSTMNNQHRPNFNRQCSQYGENHPLNHINPNEPQLLNKTQFEQIPNVTNTENLWFNSERSNAYHTQEIVSNPCSSDDVWIETRAVNGRMYYYHAKTRETRWEKPDRVQVFNLQHLKQMMHMQNMPPTQIPSIQSNETVHPLITPNYLPPIRTLFPAPTPAGISPGIFMIPPSTLCLQPPPLFTNTLPSPPVMNNSLPNFNYHNINSISTGFISEPFVARQEMDTFMEPGNVNLEILYKFEFHCNNLNAKPENVIPDTSSSLVITDNISMCEDRDEDKTNSTSNYDATLTYRTTNFEINDAEKMLEENGKTIIECSKSENIQKTSLCVENCYPMETDQLIKSDDDVNNSKLNFVTDESKTIDFMEDRVKIIDKSRPISSTPVQGTKWCIVWTGDNKVFFYDSSQKISVWKIPIELQQRYDVIELIRTPPAISTITPDDTADSPNVKKVKVSDVNEKIKDIESSNEIIVCKEEDVTLKENIPHEKRVQLFRELLTEKKVGAFSTWQKELHKIVFDPRYVLLSMRERKQVYDLHICEKIEEERRELRKEFCRKKDGFKELLKGANVTSNTKFKEFAGLHAKDPRYKAVEKLKDKEILFDEFVQNLRNIGKGSYSNEKEKNFIQLLKEHGNSCKQSSWIDVEKKIMHDIRFKAISDTLKREKLFLEYIKKYSNEEWVNNKEDKVSNSLRIREEEVKRDMSVHMKERDKEREIHKHESAVSCFKALLADMVRRTSTSWREAKKFLKTDHRWESVSNLEMTELESLFEDHIAYLKMKKKDHFRNILSEMAEITLTSSWKDVKNIIINDPRIVQLFHHERKCEKEFKEYMKNKLKSAKNDFRELLMETKIITHKSKDYIKNTNHLECIEKVLQNDKRYLILQCIAKERKEMILSYIERLYLQGSPPPPTASDPLKR